MANVQTAAPSQFSQPSRKGKKAWRKNVDLTEINQGLEQLRDEIIQGGVISELPSDALFTTDTVGSAKIRTTYVSRHKPLKADQILAERSAVPAISLRKRVGDDLTGEAAKKARKDRVSRKQLERLKHIAYHGDKVHKDVVQLGTDASYDPWEDVVVPPKPTEFNFLEDEKPIAEPMTLKHRPISLAANGRAVRAVRRPAAEKSYNPTFDEWAVRLDREGAKEVQKEQRRLDLEAREAERQRQLQQTQQQEEKEKQWDSDWESEWEGIASESEQLPEWANKKKPQRKTPVQRNKVKRRKQEEAKQIHESKMTAREHDVERVKAMTKDAKMKQQLTELKLAEQAAAAEAAESSDDGEDVQLRKRQPFGQMPVPDGRLELLLPEDLPDSLRRLRPEGNLLHDRYRSLLLQGKVEARKAQQRKGKSKKYTEKWTYKDWKLQ